MIIQAAPMSQWQKSFQTARHTFHATTCKAGSYYFDIGIYPTFNPHCDGMRMRIGIFTSQ